MTYYVILKKSMVSLFKHYGTPKITRPDSKSIDNIKNIPFSKSGDFLAKNNLSLYGIKPACSGQSLRNIQRDIAVLRFRYCQGFTIIISGRLLDDIIFPYHAAPLLPLPNTGGRQRESTGAVERYIL
jgi:hypothetical protein